MEVLKYNLRFSSRYLAFLKGWLQQLELEISVMVSAMVLAISKGGDKVVLLIFKQDI